MFSSLVILPKGPFAPITALSAPFILSNTFGPNQFSRAPSRLCQSAREIVLRGYHLALVTVLAAFHPPQRQWLLPGARRIAMA